MRIVPFFTADKVINAQNHWGGSIFRKRCPLWTEKKMP